MKFTVPVYITLDAPTAHTARVLILGMLASEKILRISYTVGYAVADFPSGHRKATYNLRLNRADEVQK